VQAGGGSHSGRSMKLAATIIDQATDDIIAKGRKIASFLFEAGKADIAFDRGRFRIAGTDRELGIFEVAAAAATRTDLPPEFQGPLAGISDQTLPVASFRTAHRSAKSRSMPKRVRSRSSAIPRSTMSDLPSTR
jgi:hypothetical protein